MKDESGLFVIMALSWPGHGVLGRGRSWWPMITNNNKSTVQKNGRNIKVVLVITILMFEHH